MYLAKQRRTTTVAPVINVQDDAELSIESSVTNESSNILLDQSNYGFSLVNLHWASFSTGLSSVLAVVLAGLFIAGCCYFRGHRQHQSRARHTELLHALSSSASRHVSSVSRPQSGVYPGSAPNPANSSDASGSTSYPIARYSASAASASCGLSGCATTY